MRVLALAPLARTYRPATGVGRYINNMLLGLAARDGFDVELLFSREYLGPDPRTPLGGLPSRTYAWRERTTERAWKLLGRPRADRLTAGADWLFLPVEARVPTRTPTVLTIHDVRALEPASPYAFVSAARHARDRRRWGWWLRPAARAAARVATVSEFTRGRVIELLGVPPEKVFVVGNGVERGYFDVADRDPAALRRPCPEPYLLSTGGLHPAKGHADLLAVADELGRRGSEIKVVFAGQRDPRAEADARRRANVVVLGFVPDDELPEYTRGAVASVLLSPYEGFGIPAAEAMAAGTPAIVADRTALPGVVGDAGLVVDPRDAAGIADLVERLSADAPFRADVARRGRGRAAALTWDACVDRLVAGLRG